MPHKVKDIFFTVDSFRCPSVPFDVDFEKGHYMRPWLGLYGDNESWSDQGLFIDYKKFKKGYTLYPVEFLNNNMLCNDTLKPKKMGAVRLQIDFTADDNPCLKVFLLCRSTETLQVDSQRAVIKNFSMGWTVFH